jgi:hypothetical protein
MIQRYKTDEMRYTLINLPTKDDWWHDSKPEYIAEGLKALRRYLQSDPQHAMKTVAMPMLGTGKGNLDYDTVLPLFYEILDDLPNPVFLSMRPSYFETPLRYLVIFGARVITDKALVRRAVDEALEKWQLVPDDFEAFVSGACDKGVDRIACGVEKGEDCLAKEMHPRPPILFPADWKRHGPQFAGFVRNSIMVDVGTHFVGLPVDPKGPGKSPGSFDTIKKVNRWNEKFPDNQKLLHVVYGSPTAIVNPATEEWAARA